MKFSVSLPTCTEGMNYPIGFATPEDLVRIAQSAERLGYYGIMGNDHITTPQAVREAFSGPPAFYELLITSAFLAAVTEHIKLIMGVIILPLRAPVILAKEVATLDVFSKGRVILGVGIGSQREEFEALYPHQAGMNRGKMLEESIQALQRLFRERRASFDGQYVRFTNVEIYPKPYQSRLPLMVSGNVPTAIQRAGRFGDGWLAAAMTPEELQQARGILQQAMEKAKREKNFFELSYQCSITIGRTREAAERNFQRWQESLQKQQSVESYARRNFLGTPEEICQQIEAYARAGVTHLAGMRFTGQNVAELLEGMQLFAETVFPVFSP